MKRIITYGTFDLMHWGHVNLLRRAREMGDHLTVGLSTEEFNFKKHKSAYFPFEERKLILESIRYVDKVIAETNWEQKRLDIEQLNIDVLVMGQDWEGEFDFLKDVCEVIYLPRTKGISTSKIKYDLND